MKYSLPIQPLDCFAAARNDNNTRHYARNDIHDVRISKQKTVDRRGPLGNKKQIDSNNNLENKEKINLEAICLDNYLKKNRHEKQMAFHADASWNRWLFGGNRTGKTEAGAVEAVMWALGCHPTRKITGATEGWVVSLSTRFGRDVAQRKILKYLDKELIIETVMLSGRKASAERGVIDYILVRNRFGTESKIGFKSCDQGREKFQGEGLDWVWFDEEPPEDIYEECLLRTLDKPGSCIWGTMTPLKGKSWVYERIYLKAGFGDKGGVSDDVDSGISCVFMSWEDNPYLSSTEVKKMQATLSATALESRKYGRFMDGTGMVFCEVHDDNIVDPFDVPAEWTRAISIDPGFTNPCAVLWIAVDPDDNIYVVADYAVAEQTVPYHVREIKKVNAELGFADSVIIDSAALARTLGSAESVVEQFEREGIHVDTRVNKDVFAGIMRMKALFHDANGNRKLFVFRSCVHLIKELRTYWWGRDERPVKKDDHCLDALRYFVMTLYQNGNRMLKCYKHSKDNANKRIISAHKSVLIRQNRMDLL